MERLSQAHKSCDLGESHDGPGDVDWLRASGAVAQKHALGLSLMRLIEDRDKREINRVFEGMLRLLPADASSPAITVSNVLSWMLDPLCKDCGGRGYDVIPGTPVLQALPCKSCDGSGHSTPAWSDKEKRLHATTQSLINDAAAAIARKLRG